VSLRVGIVAGRSTRSLDGSQMNSVEAHRILHERLGKLRAMPYEELAAKVDAVFAEEISRDSERSWQLEFEVNWDDEPSGNVRVTGMIDDGGLRAFVPFDRKLHQSAERGIRR
jgi:hypothetical protein